MKHALTAAMTSALALATAVPVVAQTYGTPYRPTDQYQQQQRDYQAQRENYEAQRQTYRDQREAYRAARAEYDRRLSDWQVRRADYDRRYGYGAYVRAYGPAPVWEESRWSYYLPPGSTYAYAAPTPSYGYATSAPGYAYAAPAPAYGSQGYYNSSPGYYSAPAAGYYGTQSAYTAPVNCNNNAAVTAGIIGALAGGVLGSNVAHHDRTAGTVLGALVGGGVGAAVGHAHDAQKCDERGAYYSYNDTVPYQVDNNVYRDDRYADYQRRGCRLAPAAVNENEYRYVRVCPDPDGRYRVTG